MGENLIGENLMDEDPMGDPVAFLQALIRAQRQGEAAVQQRVADAARRLGCTVERVRYRPSEVPMVAEFASVQAIDAGERESVVATFKGRGGGRSVIFFAHPDGEPVAAIERWRHDPFAGVIEGGRLHGWGVADDLAGVATLVQGLQAVLETGMAPLGDVILASTPSKRHARGVSALLHGGLRADAAVYLHPAESGAGMREIKAFASGLVEFRVTVDGRAPDTSEISHAAFAHRAVNPIDKIWLIHRALQALDARRGETVRHPALQQAIGRSTNLVVSHVAAGSSDAFARIAPGAVLAGSLSFPPPETLADVQSAIEAAVRGAAAEDAWLRDHPPRLAFVSGVSGAEVSPEHPLYRVVADAVRRVTGQAPHVNPLHTSSDIRNPIVQAGIPTVGLGPFGGDLTQNGLHDEWVDVEDYRRAVKVAAEVIVGWCGVGWRRFRA
ncbi:MAG: M20 family metallopeptidase [Reyranella sp.]|uniref:M20 family metallopeptidase n=1 Tax=Reyranella sp. TaxID=1929291 RepID=UPI003D148ACA